MLIILVAQEAEIKGAGSKPAQENSSWDHILKNNQHKKRANGVVQVMEFLRP
jgi:hypothetical protein